MAAPSPRRPAPSHGRGRPSWIYAALPFNVATGPIGTFVQLYIIQLNGVALGTVYASLAVSAFNAVSIPAAVIWGVATDRLRSRRLIIVTCFGATTAMLMAFLFIDSTAGVIVVYSAISFLSAAEATPLNLLIMETEPKKRWAATFALLSMVSSLGTTIGLVVSAIWAVFLPFQWLCIPLTLFSFVSLVLALLMIHEPAIAFEREMVVMQKPSFFQRFLTFPLFFLSLPRPADFKRIFMGLRNELTSHTPFLYISVYFFYLSGGVFNTSLVPSLSAHSLTHSQVFTVTLVSMVAQIVAFRYVAPYLEKRSLPAVAAASLVLRGSCYAAMGLASLLVMGVLFIVPALILFMLAGGVAYAAYYTASNTLIFNSIGSRGQGAALGVYSSIVGVATMTGSLLSGFVSFYYGFHVTFLLAAILLGLAAYMTSRLHADESGGPSIGLPPQP